MKGEAGLLGEASLSCSLFISFGMSYFTEGCMVQDDDLIGSIPLEEDLKIRVVSDPKAPPVSVIYTTDSMKDA